MTTETGYFAFSELPSGDYRVTPSRAGWRFTPEARYYDGLGLDMRDQDFVADIRGSVQVLGGRHGYIEPAMGEVASLEIVGGSSGEITVGVHTLDGDLVWETNKGISRGVESHVVWNCTDGHGNQVVSGVYLVRVSGCGLEEVRKVVIVR
jgi:hypothetical protein